ncbi:MAG TPA: hypothetical protein VM487_10715 [Phycisphaerae bacterium]|nr:hypothetical protein [Phycisphaerae bacterium]HUW30542.1 hypothetical protein [Planctomycetota bacterium]
MDWLNRNRVVLVLPLMLLASGCAIAARPNRRTLNALDSAVKPASTAGKIAAAPVFVPVGLTAVVADAVVVHPACSIPKAGSDTYTVLWKHPQGTPFRQAVVVPAKVVATPIVFLGDWCGRCIFPINAEDKPDQEQQASEGGTP